MARVKIKWNIKGFEEVRKRSDAQSAVKDLADGIAAQCGEGYIAVSGNGKTRARASVIAVTPAAIRDNRRNNTILRAAANGRRT